MAGSRHTLWLSAQALTLGKCLAVGRHALAGGTGPPLAEPEDGYFAGANVWPAALPPSLAPYVGDGPADITVDGVLDGDSWTTLLTEPALARIAELGRLGIILVELAYEPEGRRGPRRPLDWLTISLERDAPAVIGVGVRVQRDVERDAAAAAVLAGACAAAVTPAAGSSPLPGLAHGRAVYARPADIAAVIRGALKARGCRRVRRCTWTARRAPGGTFFRPAAEECRTYEAILAVGLPALRWNLDFDVRWRALDAMESWLPLMPSRGEIEVPHFGYVQLGDDRWLEVALRGWPDGFRLELCCRQGAATDEIERLVQHLVRPVAGF
jgi:hypothetical protein